MTMTANEIIDAINNTMIMETVHGNFKCFAIRRLPPQPVLDIVINYYESLGCHCTARESKFARGYSRIYIEILDTKE